MSDNLISEKFTRAANNLALARQLFSSGAELYQVCTRLKGAKNRACEAWLIQSGYVLKVYDDRDTLAGRFEERAPRELARKALVLEEKLTALIYGHIYTPAAFDGVAAPPEQAREELSACIDETAALVAHIRKGIPLPMFRWEEIRDYQPGQWVRYLASIPDFSTMTKELISKCTTTEHLVLAVKNDEVILRTLATGDIRRCRHDSIHLRPVDRLPVDMTSPMQSRRAWFDSHPQYRQIPLASSGYLDFAGVCYHTCICCGYPTLRDRLVSYEPDGWNKTDYEICRLCAWAGGYADDGQNLDEEDPLNCGYSLRQARIHYEQTGLMVTSTDGYPYNLHHDAAVVAAKAELRGCFDAMVCQTNQGRIFLLWWRAEKFRQDFWSVYREYATVHTQEYREYRSLLWETRSPMRHRLDWRDDVDDLHPGKWVISQCDGPCRIVAVSRPRGSITLALRTYRRELVHRVSLPVSKSGRLPSDDFWTPFYARRTWFEFNPEYLRGYLPCPCCACPTITGFRQFEQCPVCRWTDDGQDDEDVFSIRPKSPNGMVALAQARANFERTLCMFGPHAPELQEHADCWPENRHRKRQMLELYERLIITVSSAEAALVWRELDDLGRQPWEVEDDVEQATERKELVAAHLVQRALHSLTELARGLATGQRQHVTRLNVLLPLLRHEDVRRTFTLWLIGEVEEEFRSTGFSPLLSVTAKRLLFRRVRAVVGHPELYLNAARENLRMELQNLQPGWKRIGQRATRRKALDRDLLLLEYATSRCGNGMIYLYLTTYEGYRYIFRTDAVERIRGMVDFWRGLFAEKKDLISDNLQLNRSQ